MLRTQSSVFSGHVTHAVFEFVKRFLHDLVHLIWWVRCSALAEDIEGEAGIDGEHRLDLHIFAPLEVLQEAESVRVALVNQKKNKIIK